MPQLLMSAGTGLVLAHDSDPVAIIGFFGPALLLVAIVIGAVVYDRRRHGPERRARRTNSPGEATPPRAD